MDRIAVYDLNGHRLGYFDKYSNLCLKKTMDSWDELSFDVPSNSKTTRLVQNELRLHLGTRRFVIKDFQPSRDKNGPTLKVTAPSIASDLNYKPRQVVGTYLGTELYSNWSPHTRYEMFDRVRYYGVVYECRQAHTSGTSLSGTQWSYWTTCKIQAELVELVMTLPEFMQFALQDTGWRVGKVDDDGASRTFSGTWVSVPALLKEGCEKYDRHVVYHDDTMTVDLIMEPGADKGVTIEYAKNLRGISKSSDSTDFVTKLFPYGDEELTVNLVNVHGSSEHALYRLQNLQSFILNFDFFLAQGYTEDDIYASILADGDGSPFIRINKLDMSDYIDDAALYRDSVKQMKEELAHPEVTYKIDFLDLSEVGLAPNEKIDICDWVWVRDAELGVDVKVRVTSMTVYPGYPEKSTAQLSNKNDFFGDAIASTLGYTQKMADNQTIANLMRNYINTFTTTINSATGDLIWKDGQLTSVELDENGRPTGRQVRLSPAGLGVSTDFGVTYGNAITGDGVLANRVVADSIHILSVGSDGIIIEPNTAGVRLNNTEGIIVQSKDKRFMAQMNASNNMSGSSWGFSLYNGEFVQKTLTQSGSYYYLDGQRTNITTALVPASATKSLRVGPNGQWYIYRNTTLKVEETIDPSTRQPLAQRMSSGRLYIGGQNTGFNYQDNQDIVAGDDGCWVVGYPTGITSEYQGQSLVFGVNMNGDAYFNGVVRAQDFQDPNGESIYTYIDDQLKLRSKYLDLGKIQLYGTTGDIVMTGKIILGDYPNGQYIIVNGNNGGINMTGAMNLGKYANGGWKGVLIDANGNVKLSGSVTWDTQNSPIKILYARTALATPTLEYSQYSATNINQWHRTLNVTYDYYASYSYDGGVTWTAAYQIRGEKGEKGDQGNDGARGPQGPAGSDADVTRYNIYRALLNNSQDGIYSYGGEILLRASYLQSDYINSNYVFINGYYGGICMGSGSTGTRTTWGAKLFGSNGPGSRPYVIATDAGASLVADSCSIWAAGGTCASTVEMSVSSDERVKEKIVRDLSEYEGLFMRLQPAHFRYKNGTSGRSHLGFIAQDVEKSLFDEGISTKAFAPLTIEDVDDDDDGTPEDSLYMLRYGEFVALNTHMIQKLMKEVTELRNELAEIKGRG